MASSSDWQHREFIQEVQFNILKICQFLNNFDTTVRFRLSKVDAKLTVLERQMDFLETAVEEKKNTAPEDN
eukprot:CAMPEP_0197515990 /NCGR_PEP_ID=MMETSP1318-20131121/920_1 /TAXON_ID=552666 /ORGANISM="Partenskyella glossopodia, Strain RCC365" /LENGTH=70 /DNA_ID=CAMNT_0043064481 /DNA_START=18 /DNA_END=230 /DNA_ORIENTATION=+